MTLDLQKYNSTEALDNFLWHLGQTRWLKAFIDGQHIKFVPTANLKTLCSVLVEYYTKYKRATASEVEFAEFVKGRPNEDLLKTLFNNNVFIGNGFGFTYGGALVVLKERYVAAEAERIIAQAKDGLAIEEVVKGLDKLVRIKSGVQLGTISALGEDVEEKIAFLKSRREIKPMSSGYFELDKTLDGGFRRGGYYVLSGVTGTGKTRVSMCLVQKLVSQENSGIVFSFEMQRYEIESMYIAAAQNVNVNALQNARLEDSAIENAYHALEGTGNNLAIFQHISAEFPPTLGMITETIELHLQTNTLDFILIDYIQLMHAPGYDNEKRHLMLGYISDGLKALAVRYNVAVIALAQSVKGKRGDEGFEVRDIGESYKITHVADFVAGIMRSKISSELSIEPAKNRYGPASKIKYLMDWKTNTLTELEDPKKDHQISNYDRGERKGDGQFPF